MPDIHKLLEICLSECFFLYSNEIWKLDNLEEIGLSIMVVLPESFLRRLEERSIAIALTLDIALKTFKRYINDSHARFQNKVRYIK